MTTMTDLGTNHKEVIRHRDFLRDLHADQRAAMGGSAELDRGRSVGAVLMVACGVAAPTASLSVRGLSTPG